MMAGRKDGPRKSEAFRPCPRCEGAAGGCSYCGYTGKVRQNRHDPFDGDNASHLLRVRGDPLKRMPPEEIVEVSPDTTSEGLVTYLKDAYLFGMSIYDRLAEAEHPAASADLAAYARVQTNLLDLATRIEQGRIGPTRYGDLSAERVIELKREFAHIMRRLLSQMTHVANWSKGQEVIREVERRGVTVEEVAPWVGQQGARALLSAMTTPLERWASLLAYERRPHQVGDEYERKVIELIRGNE